MNIVKQFLWQLGTRLYAVKRVPIWVLVLEGIAILVTLAGAIALPPPLTAGDGLVIFLLGGVAGTIIIMLEKKFETPAAEEAAPRSFIEAVREQPLIIRILMAISGLFAVLTIIQLIVML